MMSSEIEYFEKPNKIKNRKYKSRNRPFNNYDSRSEMVSKKDLYDENWLIKLEKKVKESIPETIRRFVLASYKEIEEDLEKLNYQKSQYNYLSALDDLLQNKKIFLVHQKPDVFALQKEVSNDKLQRYLIYLQELKLLNTIKNAPKKQGAKTFLSNIISSCSNTKLDNLNHAVQVKSISSTTQCCKCSCSNESLNKTESNSSENTQCIKVSTLNENNKTNLNTENDDVENNNIENKDEQNLVSGVLNPLTENQDQNEENCKEESVKDLSNKIIISNIVVSKSGDKGKAKRRKARRIRKASKNAGLKKSNEDKENQEEDDDEVTSTFAKVANDEKNKSENLKYENSSQISSANSDSEDNLEILPDSEMYPSEEIYQKISEAGFDYESIITRFANWNRSPISALNEFGQICHIAVKLEITDSNGPDHAKLFQATALLDKKKLSVAWGKSKKRAKGCASELAIRAITASLPSERCDLDVNKYSNHFDQLAVTSYAKFNELLVIVPNYVNFGRKILSTILMKTPKDAYGKPIAVGTGNRCVSGEYLVTNGKVIFDSHAEVIARRSFLVFLMKQIEFYKMGEESIFEKEEDSELLKLKPDITFHLYISTAPCGDGALFTHSSDQTTVLEENTEEHIPLFETFLHGRLRTKMEAGEGTISLDENYTSPELDQILRGERLRTMSCSDKICRWNLLGIQGSLLLHFIKPIYLDTISLGALYNVGHLSRACCCRLDQSYFQESLEKMNNFKINHPTLGCPSSFKFPREPVKTKSDSLNWSLYDESPELTNGNTGLKFNMEPSRISKCELFNSFKNLCDLFGKEELKDLTYYEVKNKVVEYNELKKVFFDFFRSKKYGPWVCKPMETKVFK